GGRCEARLKALLPRIPGAVECAWTEGPGPATSPARRAAVDGADRGVAGGGDGTLCEVGNGLFESDRRPALGVLPLGTGTSFARDFGVHEPEPALRALRGDGRRPVDVVRVVHRDGVLHYVNLLSVGFTAAAGALTNRRFKRFGPSGYVLAVLASLVRLEHPRFP